MRTFGTGIPKALTIAGSDSGGGAGIQADLKTFQELDVYGMSVLTAVTAQNTLGVRGVYQLTVEAIVEQLTAIEIDLAPQAAKTGMLFSGEIIAAVASCIRRFGWSNLVVDPVMIAKGGTGLLQEEAVQALKEHLLPLAKIVTPNVPEAEKLTGKTLNSLADRKEAAKQIADMGAQHVVIKGGHLEEDAATDLFFDGRDYYELTGPRVYTNHTHGTGCTFSAAITAELAAGKTPLAAVKTAKAFIQAAIEYPLSIGSGHGPTNHWAYRKYSQWVGVNK
ncbi:bifunctional hydroxymethylpyrimidine kinase/phosphomethylpyrimidine kinase [Brevibacillus sp. B_LB10_24]|uniref:bifunctional hydroxymethylpyrimidine kinase/phosphomethylpyrimidine kinase n=1 Tax=Brevibacillus sp. B_LB10_24 TaxID=3380645 RepID=UPI0038BB6AA1